MPLISLAPETEHSDCTPEIKTEAYDIPGPWNMIICTAVLPQQLSAQLSLSQTIFPSANWSQDAGVAIATTLFTCSYLDLETMTLLAGYFMPAGISAWEHSQKCWSH